MTFDLASAWETIADHRGDALAVQCGDISRSWTEFEARAARLAGALARAGIGAGDNIALALYNGNEYIEAEFAAFKVRAAPCNVNYRYVEAELEYLVDNSDAKAVVFDVALAPAEAPELQARPARPRAKEDEQDLASQLAGTAKV